MHVSVWLIILVLALQAGLAVSNYDDQRVDTFNLLEDALLYSKTNRFLLRETFFSSSKRPPALLTVIYNIVTTNSSIEQYKIGWSRSSVFTTISPETVWALQSGILTIAFLLEGIAQPSEIVLTLNIATSEVPQSLSSSDIREALETITERVC